MQNILDEIVADLISLDPEFAKIESEIRALASKMISAKPNSEIDSEFKKQLKNELLARIEELKNVPPKSFSNPLKMQKFFYSLAGAAIAIAVFVGFQNYDRIFSSQIFDDDSSIEFEISSIEPQAFGSLATNSATNEISAVGKGGGGVVSEKMVDSRIAIDYDFETYKYVYNGALNLPFGEVEVLRRVKNRESTASLASSLARFDFGLLNFGAFQNVEIQNYNFAENREFGFSVFVDLIEGNISINKNWQKWPDLYADCGDEGCYESLRLKKSEMLDDSKIISLAQKFVQKFGINLQNYGAPEIQNNWKRDLARFVGSESDYYFPETISAIFPLKIQNKFVYNSSGEKEGVSVSIDQREERVVGLYNLTTQNYESSRYTAVADENFFREFLSRGGLWGGYSPENARVVEIELGEPQEILMKYWNYANGEGEELILPALRFPILENNSNIYQTSIVVPLVAEILEKQNSNDSPILYRENILEFEKIENDSNQNNSDPDDGKES